jgi:hypothetical protein
MRTGLKSNAMSGAELHGAELRLALLEIVRIHRKRHDHQYPGHGGLISLQL